VLAPFLGLVLIVAVAMLAAGCGSHGLGLTGGSIPIGTARLQGRAVRADDITRPVANASVVLSVGEASAEARTDSEGRFSFERIAGGTYLCTIVPANGATLRPWSYYFQFPDGARAQLTAGILPSTVDPASIAQVRIVPGHPTVSVGNSVQITAQALDRNGQVMSVRGSLLLVGDLGDMGPDGTLHATKSGSATLVAWAGNSMTIETVTVVP
jgi:hypothetical protein